MILVAIGSNLADAGGRTSLDVCRDAVAAMAEIPGLGLVAVSRWYRSKPVPASEQPDYVNGVARFEGGIGPEALLAALQAIEARFGRVRSVANASRTLDLDIVAMGEAGGMVRDAPDPVLPHPRAWQRGFVLLPVRDVAPGWVEPRSGRTVQVLIELLPGSDVAALR